MSIVGKPKLVLGLDIGTSSAKVCAVDLQGKILGVEHEAYPTSHPHPGWAEQNAGDWLPALGTACRRLLKQLGVDRGDVLGLAVTSAAHIGVLLDANGNVLRPSLLWNDQRSKVEASELAASHGEFIFQKGNNWPTTTWTLPHLAWLKRHDSDSWAKMRHFLLSKDYIVYRLTGRLASDPAAAVSALLYDVHEEKWSSDICALIGLPLEVLPEVLPIGAEIGTVGAEGAELLGVSQDAIVFNGTMDSTAETLSASVHSEHQCVIRLASAGGIHAISKDANPHPKLISYPYPIAPYWLSQAGTATCAAAVNWARDLFCMGTKNVDFAAWSDLASQSPPGARGLLFHPYLLGERCPHWDPELRASFIGLGLHHSVNDIARAVYEGTAYSLRDAMSVLVEQGFKPTQIKLVGGGAKSKIWCQIISNVFGFPVIVAPEADSSYGGALLTLRGLGISPDHEKATFSTGNPDGRSVLHPDARLQVFYDKGFELYRYSYRQVSSIYHQPWPTMEDA